MTEFNIIPTEICNVQPFDTHTHWQKKDLSILSFFPLYLAFRDPSLRVQAADSLGPVPTLYTTSFVRHGKVLNTQQTTNTQGPDRTMNGEYT